MLSLTKASLTKLGDRTPIYTRVLLPISSNDIMFICRKKINSQKKISQETLIVLAFMLEKDGITIINLKKSNR